MNKAETPIWPEAEIVAQPEEGRSDPAVLVRRRSSGLVGPNGEEMVLLDGPPCISLFTGCGGMDIGTEWAGFSTVLQHEWEYNCCLTLLGNRPNYFRSAALIQGDIRKTPTEMILDVAGLEVGEAHLLTGGPPCQGFSTCNSNRGKKKDARNDLVFEFIRVIREAKPKYFCMENVPGILSFNKGEYFKAFLAAAFESFYELVYGLIDCSEYQVPQRRVRFICMGTRKDLARKGVIASLPEPQCFGGADLQRLKVLDKIATPEALWESRILTHAPGIRYFPDRPVLVPPSPHGTNESRSKRFLDFYDAIEKNEPDRIVRRPQLAAA
jgi:DNA-cytosine methyltransferase